MNARALAPETVPGSLTSYTFRCVASHELPLVNELYNRCHQTNRSLAEAEWLYRDNPYGEGIVFGAFDSQDHLVGVRPTIAWRFSWAGREKKAYQFTDAIVAPEHRGKGIFHRLVRDMCNLAAESDVSLFSFPNSNSLPIYLRMGLLERIASCRTVVKVLAWGKYIQYRCGREVAHAASSRVDDGASRVTAGELSLLPIGRFQSDFEDIGAELGRVVARFTLRRKDFLNWRYFECPDRQYRVALVKFGDRTAGYVVIRMMHHIAHVIDVFVRPTSMVVDAVPPLLTRWARRMDAIAVYFDASKTNIFERAFLRDGFLLRRTTGDIVLDTRSRRELATAPHRSSSDREFYFAIGDSDGK
jgi:GNAT superfamily N-acetyltransferase